MRILEKIKPLSLVALAAIFFLSATLISCGDGKKEAASEDEATEEVMEEKTESEHPEDAASEHPSSEEESDSTKMEESDSTKEEHPSGEGEHPSN